MRVVSQKTRDQAQNLADARDKLAAMIAAALIAPKPRKPTRPTFGSKLRRADAKRRQANKKRLRGRRGSAGNEPLSRGGRAIVLVPPSPASGYERQRLLDDQPRTARERQIRPRPLDQHEQPVLEPLK